MNYMTFLSVVQSFFRFQFLPPDSSLCCESVRSFWCCCTGLHSAGVDLFYRDRCADLFLLHVQTWNKIAKTLQLYYMPVYLLCMLINVTENSIMCLSLFKRSVVHDIAYSSCYLFTDMKRRVHVYSLLRL